MRRRRKAGCLSCGRGALGKTVDRAGLSEEGHERSVVVSEVGKEARGGAILDGAQEDARGHGRLGRQTRLVERLAHAAHQGFDMRVGYALIDADEGNAEPLAAMRQNLPVSQVKTTHDEGLRAARRLVETFRRLEDDAVALR